MIEEEKEQLVENQREEQVQQEQEESTAAKTEEKAEIPTTTETEKEDGKSRFQKRIDTLVRRAGEAERERDEAVTYLRTVIAERDKERAEKMHLSETTAKASIGEADANIEFYKKQFKEAFEVGDSEKAMEAQAKLAELHVAKSKAKTWADRIAKEKQLKTPIQDEEGGSEPQVAVRKPPQSVEAPGPSKLALKWHERNQWYGKDAEASAAALVANRKLVSEGYDPDSQEFYDELDNRIKRFIPKEQNENEQETRNVRPTTVASGSKRTGNATAETRLTDAQKRLINRLGISEKEYKEQMRKLEEN